MVDGAVERTVAGTPQGGVISPLLANIYLHVLDTELSARGVGELVRYADDGVVLCRSAAQAERGPGRGGGDPRRRWGCGCTRTRRRWWTCGKAGRAWTSSAVTSAPACRVGCGSSTRIVRYYLHRWPSPAGDEAAAGRRSGTGPVATVQGGTFAR